MCKEHEEILTLIKDMTDEIHEFKGEVVRRLAHLEHRTETASKQIENIETCFATTKYIGVIDRLDLLVCGDQSKNKLGLEVIVNGSDELGVEPLRTTVKRIATAYDRVVWLLGILGVTTITGLVGWILFFLNRGLVP